MNIVPSIPLSAPRVEERLRLAFTGEGGAFLRLLIRGGLLLIPTLGFYRFWLITDVRRYLWGNTHVGGETLEYTGTARELVIGFLIALAVLTPLYVVYFILGLLAEEIQAFASIPLALVLYVFGHYAAFRARRYRATRTVFRGVRFWMTGSAWSYAGRAAFWDLLVLLTLGLAYPWRAAALERYKMRHTRFGDLAGGFDGRALTFFKRGVLLWLVAVGVPVLVCMIAVLQVLRGSNSAGAGQPVGFGPAVAVVAALMLLPLMFPLFQAIQLRWTLDGIRFGPVEAESDLPKSKVYGLYARMVLVLVGFGLVAAVAMGIIGGMASDSFGSLAEGTTAITPALALALGLTALAYLGLLIGFGIVTRYFLGRGLWAAAVASVTLANLSSADGVIAMGAPASSVGEGLADALDVGAF